MDKYQELEKWIKSVDARLDNHLIHVEGRLSNIERDTDWIKRFFWLVSGVSITSIIGVLFGLILK